MDTRVVLRQLLRAPAAYRILIQTSPRFTLPSLGGQQQRRYLSLPRIITPSFWASLIPKPLRKNPLAPSPAAEAPASEIPTPSRRRNPATPIIILSLLVGSQAIQTLWLKRDREHYMRRAEAKMGVLREIIEKVQKGETVEVEKVLGTGDAVLEKEWKDVLGEIAEEEALFQSKKKRREEREAELLQQELERENQKNAAGQLPAEDGKVKVETYQGARFY